MALTVALSGCAVVPAIPPSGASASASVSPSPSALVTPTPSPWPSPTPGPSPSGPHSVFTTTGSMSMLGGPAVATLLNDGEVLVIGINPGPAELYDPATGRFRPTGSPNDIFVDESALLGDGRVLVLTDGTSAEIYDPKAGKFSPPGSLSVWRATARATSLANGQVLVAGGFTDADGAVASAEIYTPATGKFSRTGEMKTARECFTATLLHTGRVLIVGGDDMASCSPKTIVFASAEIYDPKSGKFSQTGSMSTPRNRATATLLPDRRVLIAGGYDGEHYVSSAELYDPTTGKFSPTGSMSTARSDFSATLLHDGRILVAGGVTENADLSAPAEIYDPATGKFSPTGRMTQERAYQTATLLTDGRVLIAGGDSIGTSAELYWP